MGKRQDYLPLHKCVSARPLHLTSNPISPPIIVFVSPISHHLLHLKCVPDTHSAITKHQSAPQPQTLNVASCWWIKLRVSGNSSYSVNQECTTLNLPRVEWLKDITITDAFGQEEPQTSHLGEWERSLESKILVPKIYFRAEYCFHKASWPSTSQLPSGTFCGQSRRELSGCFL